MSSRSSRRRILYQVAIDVLLINVATLLAITLRFTPAPIPAQDWSLYVGGILPLTLLRLGCIAWQRLYRISWRYVGLYDLIAVVKAVTASSALFACALVLSGESRYSRGVLILDWLLAILLLGGVRLSLRLGTIIRAGLKAQRQIRRNLLIVGAGDHGEALARELARNPEHAYRLVGYLDDDPAKQRLLIHGAPVLGSMDQIESVVRNRGIQEVIIAIPSASGAEIRRILALCEGLPVRLRITPGFTALPNRDGSRRAPIRDVAPEDLLRRPPVHVNLDSIAGYLAGQRVLVTGGGGSIGAELVRQVLRFEPAQILMLGRGENSIFEVEQELKARDGGRGGRPIDLVPIIADIRDRDRLEQIFAAYRPTVVFHAAAHKHVPLMEDHPQEAVKNNVLGTRHLLELASRHRVARFVLISSDKAVNPSSIMGCTKRIAELMLQSEAERSPGTRFMAVRFGNVLGSRGSVVLTMRRQIAERRPVTVTHPRMVRYFMTIPEAVQLVIQAGALGVHGETFLLDMGEPVRILDLAKDLIRLSGFVPGEEIPIQFTGIRPGEKLFEELLTAEEGVTATQHERILVAPPSRHDPLQLDRQVEELIALAEAGRVEAVRMKLAEIVPDFHLRRGDPATSASRGDGRPPGSAPGGETAQETGRGGEKTRAPSPPGADRRLAPSQKGLVL